MAVCWQSCQAEPGKLENLVYGLLSSWYRGGEAWKGGMLMAEYSGFSLGGARRGEDVRM